MRSVSIATASVLVATFGLVLLGCGRPAPPPAGHAHHDHGHEGPHGGHIIELGSAHHHAELTHDEETHRVGIYILDGRAAQLAPIEAQSVTIIASVDGESSQYELPAVPQPGDPEGRASYFELESEPLHAIVAGEAEAETTHARLSLTIEGQRYVGLIETDPHDHHHHPGGVLRFAQDVLKVLHVGNDVRERLRSTGRKRRGVQSVGGRSHSLLRRPDIYRVEHRR
jgi:hypothetical protein